MREGGEVEGEEVEGEEVERRFFFFPVFYIIFLSLTL